MLKARLLFPFWATFENYLDPVLVIFTKILLNFAYVSIFEKYVLHTRKIWHNVYARASKPHLEISWIYNLISFYRRVCHQYFKHVLWIPLRLIWCRISRRFWIWPPFWPLRSHTRAQVNFPHWGSNKTILLFWGTSNSKICSFTLIIMLYAM